VLEQDALGPGAARQAGARAARCDLIALCDDDAVPAADWLEQAAACWNGTAAGIEGMTRALDVGPADTGVLRNTRGGMFLTCNLFLTREAMLACAPDRRFKHPFREDLDLALQVRQRFGEIQFCPSVKVSHPPSSAPISHLLRTATWHWYDGLVVRRHGGQVHGLGALALPLPGGRTLTVWRAKQRVASVQFMSWTLLALAPPARRSRAVRSLAVGSVLAAVAWEQRHWVAAALESGPRPIASPRRLRAAAGQAGRQAVASYVRGAAYLAGRARWRFAPRG
jgi:hypothetical protein